MVRRRNQFGFGTMELFLVVIILVAIGVAAWVIHNHHATIAPKSSSTTTSTKLSTRTPVKAAGPSADWILINSISGGYSMKLPDGWTVTNYPGNTINADAITFKQGKAATVITADTTYNGDQKKFNVVLTDSIPLRNGRHPISLARRLTATTQLAV